MYSLKYYSFNGAAMFYLLMTVVQNLFQVIDGGDLDIDFTLQSPDGRIMHMETRKTENVLKSVKN